MNKKTFTLFYRIWIILGLISILLNINTIIFILLLGLFSYVISKIITEMPLYKKNEKIINTVIISLIVILFIITSYILVKERVAYYL